MDRKKQMTQRSNSAGEYLAPRIKVKELRHRSVLCASLTGNGINSVEEDENTDI